MEVEDFDLGEESTIPGLAWKASTGATSVPLTCPSLSPFNRYPLQLPLNPNSSSSGTDEELSDNPASRSSPSGSERHFSTVPLLPPGSRPKDAFGRSPPEVFHESMFSAIVLRCRRIKLGVLKSFSFLVPELEGWDGAGVRLRQWASRRGTPLAKGLAPWSSWQPESSELERRLTGILRSVLNLSEIIHSLIKFTDTHTSVLRPFISDSLLGRFPLQ
jgi:hypothetical protein